MKKQGTHGSTKYSQWFQEKTDEIQHPTLSELTLNLSTFFFFFVKADTGIIFPKHHVLLLKISWQEAHFAVGIQYSLDSPIYIITPAHLIIYNLHLELLNPFFSHLFPVPLGGCFILGKEKREEERREERGNHWQWLGVGNQAAGCGLWGLYLLSQLVKEIMCGKHFI